MLCFVSVCLSVCLSVSLSLYIYIHILSLSLSLHREREREREVLTFYVFGSIIVLVESHTGPTAGDRFSKKYKTTATTLTEMVLVEKRV